MVNRHSYLNVSPLHFIKGTFLSCPVFKNLHFEYIITKTYREKKRYAQYGGKNSFAKNEGTFPM